ncbi:hypothetical protein DRO22_03485, partial [Candidatus Bathyarchaeota archaeon]
MSEPNNFPTLKALVIFSLILYLGSVSFLGFTIKELQKTVNEENEEIAKLNDQISQMRNELSHLKEKIHNVSVQPAFSYTEIYEMIKDSVVVVRGKIVRENPFFGKEYASVQGSGFIYNYSGTIIVITNNHVIEGALNITISFLNGDTYPAQVLGR